MLLFSSSMPSRCGLRDWRLAAPILVVVDLGLGRTPELELPVSAALWPFLRSAPCLPLIRSFKLATPASTSLSSLAFVTTFSKSRCSSFAAIPPFAFYRGDDGLEHMLPRRRILEGVCRLGRLWRRVMLVRAIKWTTLWLSPLAKSHAYLRLIATVLARMLLDNHDGRRRGWRNRSRAHRHGGIYRHRNVRSPVLLRDRKSVV